MDEKDKQDFMELLNAITLRLLIVVGVRNGERPENAVKNAEMAMELIEGGIE